VIVWEIFLEAAVQSAAATSSAATLAPPLGTAVHAAPADIASDAAPVAHAAESARVARYALAPPLRRNLPAHARGRLADAPGICRIDTRALNPREISYGVKDSTPAPSAEWPRRNATVHTHHSIQQLVILS